MHNTFLSHDLAREFPDLADRVHQLQASNGHFARLFDQHNVIDSDIQKAERGLIPLDDFSLEDMKKKRLKLKDDLYQILIAAK
jgi:uncharacterized protein